ncbi:MAG TPA: hypothetical protein PK743_10410 [Luteimonas sp.]|nr:hypothetical protein [Luteimonas sp.]HRO25930.1 hypothetical protein [Luteimonas sp.]HRP73034.1 hypothetical protein [Luteimonas sp.]
MTRCPPSRSPDPTPSLRHVEALLLGALFLGAIAMLSLPAARGTSAALGWMPLWLLGLPAASLVTARLLAWSRRGFASVPPTTVRRRRPAAVTATRRRTAAPRRGSRLLAAIVLR